MSPDVGFCLGFVFQDMVIFRKVFGFEKMYMNPFRRCVSTAKLFYFIPDLSCILVEGLVRNAILSAVGMKKGLSVFWFRAVT